MSFPPHLPNVRHVVINSSGGNQLALRTGISSLLIPNVMDFETEPPPPDDWVRDLRSDLGVHGGKKLILQPTRVVQRKGIEHAIELVHQINMPAKLIISHASGDEGDEYEQRVRSYAQMFDVQTNFVSDLIQEQRGTTADGRRVYTLGDVYQQADLVTYPSSIEGFGNAFLEAIYFRRPIVVNNYSIFATDIKPKGFRVIEFDGYITDSTVQQTCRLLQDPEAVREIVDYNYALGRRYYSFKILSHQLQMLLDEFFGVD